MWRQVYHYLLIYIDLQLNKPPIPYRNTCNFCLDHYPNPPLLANLVISVNMTSCGEYCSLSILDCFIIEVGWSTIVIAPPNSCAVDAGPPLIFKRKHRVFCIDIVLKSQQVQTWNHAWCPGCTLASRTSTSYSTRRTPNKQGNIRHLLLFFLDYVTTSIYDSYFNSVGFLRSPFSCTISHPYGVYLPHFKGEMRFHKG